MAIDHDSRIRAVANSMALRAVGLIVSVLAGPLIVAGLIGTYVKIDNMGDRLTGIETLVKAKLPDAYPRGEADANFNDVRGQVNSLKGDVQDISHRTGALEAARARALQ